MSEALVCRILIGKSWNRSPFLSPESVCVENQENMSYEGILVKSTAGIRKEDHAVHATAEVAVVD